MSKVETEILNAFSGVAVSNICDVLEFNFGLRGFMSHDVKPLFKCKIVGRAVTLMEIACLEPQPNAMQHLFEAVDACGAGSVLVANNGSNKAASVIGDLVALALQARGAEGAVLDGAVRDVEPIIQIGFPVFASSISPASGKHKVVTIGYNLPIVCGGVQVNPGDITVGDSDGVVVVPADKAEAVLEQTIQLEQKEARIAARIREAIHEKNLAGIFAEFN
jgi:4-hydroxy-4-methyl-2-oxoglutarate aldolase